MCHNDICPILFYGVLEMITKREIYVNQETGDVKMKNHFNIGTAKELAKEDNQYGQRMKDVHCLGYIPPEMWSYDPWLIMARKAQYAHDDYEYQKYIKKFFEVHSALRVHTKQKYYQGWCAK